MGVSWRIWLTLAPLMDNKVNKLGLLRNIDVSELELMLAWRNAPSVRSNMYTTHEISLEEHLKWWERVSDRGDMRYFMYEFDGKPLGIVGFTEVDTVQAMASWAFYASPNAPKGTGSRMEFLALDYAFKELCLHKLSCEVLAFNTPVIRLHEKFNFKVEGVLREHHLVEGNYVDVYRLGLLSQEWESHRYAMCEKLLKLYRGQI